MISYFTNHSQNIPVGSLTIQELHSQLVNPDQERFIPTINMIQRLRSTTDEKEQKNIKGELLAFTPGAQVDTRAAAATPEQKNIRYSGFMQIDIDLQDNPNMTSAAEIRDKLIQIPYIALSAISARGKGVWGLIALSEPEKFSQYAEQVSDYFMTARVTIDKTKSKNPTELRYFSPDSGAILKTDYKLFPLMQVPVKQKPKQNTVNHNYTGTTLETSQIWVTETTGFDLVDGQKHYYLFWLAYSLRKSGTDEIDVYQTIYNNVLAADCIKSNCISGGIAHANAKGIYTLQQARSTPQQAIQLTPNPLKLAQISKANPISEPELIQKPIKAQEPLEKVEQNHDHEQLQCISEPKPEAENWSSIIDELENFFKSITLPTEPVKIDTCTTISDVLFFIDSHLQIVKAQNGKKTFKPYLSRLQQLKLYLN